MNTKPLSERLTELAHLRANEIPKGDDVPNTFAFGWTTAMTIAAVEARKVALEAGKPDALKAAIEALPTEKRYSVTRGYLPDLVRKSEVLKALDAAASEGS